MAWSSSGGFFYTGGSQADRTRSEPGRNINGRGAGREVKSPEEQVDEGGAGEDAGRTAGENRHTPIHYLMARRLPKGILVDENRHLL